MRRLAAIVRRMRPAHGLSLPYALTLFAVAASWVFWYRPAVPAPLAVYASSLLGLATLFGVYLWIDSRLRDGAFRFLLAGTLSLFTAYVLIDAALLSITSIRLHHALTILHSGGDLLTTLDGAGFTLRRLAQIAGALVAAFIGGGVAHRLSPRLPRPRGRVAVVMTAALLLLPTAFVAEQLASRSRNEYHVRDMVFPAYVALFNGGVDGFTEPTPTPPDEALEDRWLRQIDSPRRPHNVVFFLLESVSHDVYAEGHMPRTAELASRGLDFRRAFAAGSHTHLSWNVLLMDRQPQTVWLDTAAPRRARGSFPIEALKRAGYDVYGSISTLFDYKGFARRVRGGGHLFDRYFQATDPSEELGRVALWDMSEADLAATDHAVEWIRDQPTGRPFFLLVNLDATHFPYLYPPDEAALPACDYETARSGGATLAELHNRYRNSARFVDSQVGRVLDALRAAGHDRDTAVVIVSDHGEGFAPGTVGRGSMTDEIRRVPLVLRLPGVTPRSVDHIVSHQDVWPTLFDHLGIGGIRDEMFRGRSLLRSRSPGGAIVVAGNMEVADFVTDAYTLRFRVKHNYDQMTFLPVSILGPDDRPLSDDPAVFAELVAEARPMIRSFLKSEQVQSSPPPVESGSIADVGDSSSRFAR